MTVSALGFAVMVGLVKLLSGKIPVWETVFFRSAANLAFAALWLLARREQLVRKERPLLLFRGVMGSVSLLCLFYSIGHLPLTIAMMTSWSSPVFVVLYSWLFLKERTSWSQMVSLAGGLAALALILDLHASAVGTDFGSGAVSGGLVAFVGAACAGWAYLAVRKASATVSVMQIVFHFAGVATLVSMPLAFAGWVSPAPADLLWLVLMGLSATLGQVAMTSAYRFARAGVVSTMGLLTSAFSALIGWFGFGERLLGSQWAGIAILALAVGYLSLSSARAARVASAPA